MTEDYPEIGVKSPPSDRLAFDYIKGNDFRVMRADGVLGGVTPNGHIHVVFWSERTAIPRRLVHQISPDGGLGELLPDETMSRHSMVRELHGDLFLTPDAARQVRDWLTARLDEYAQRENSGE